MSTLHTCISFRAKHDLRSDLLVTLEVKKFQIQFTGFLRMLGCNKSTILELIGSWMRHLCFCFLAHHNPSFPSQDKVERGLLVGAAKETVRLSKRGQNV